MTGGETSTAFADAAARVRAGADPSIEAAALVAAMTPEERRWCLDGDVPFWAGLEDLGRGGYHRRPFPAGRVDRLGIPGFAFSDGPRGVVIGPATAFPVSMARGATWDVDLEERIGEAIGRELRAVGATLYGGVCVNILRHPAWGRAQETYGEDPYHVGELGAALTRGVQRHAMACVKHFACNSMENARFSVDVAVDHDALHEVFLPHFRRVVDEGVAVVMSAYNAVNGEWCGESPALLTQVLREEWGFEGFVISDWIFGLRDAGRSVAAGLDVEMPYRMMRAERLDAALEAGTCSWDQIDASVTRTLATLLRFAEVLEGAAPSTEVLACDAHRALSREAATASLVLLRNEPVAGAPVLPISEDATGSVAVIGRLADVRNIGDGGSSDVWTPSVVTPAAGLTEVFGSGRVFLDDGSDPARAAAVATAAEVAVVVVGYTKDDEGEFIGDAGTAHLVGLMPGPDDPDLADAFRAELAADTEPFQKPGRVAGEGSGFSDGGDRSSLRLRDDDVALIRAVAAANSRTVVAIVAGSAVLIDEWVDAVPAVAQSWYAGMEGGRALADVLVGRAEPSGRLPFTVPVDEADLPPFDRDATAATYDAWHGYWRLARDGRRAAYPFGFGLSYTELAIEGARATRSPGGGACVTASVSNTGARPGVEVVQVYAGSPARLVGFARRELAPGERADVSIDVTVPTGTTEVRVGRHAEDQGSVVILPPETRPS